MSKKYRFQKTQELQVSSCEHDCDLGNETLKEIIAHVKETGHTIARAYDVVVWIRPEDVR